MQLLNRINSYITKAKNIDQTNKALKLNYAHTNANMNPKFP